VTPAREILRLLAAVNDGTRTDLSLTALAGLAHRSRFDLHRRFRAITGETPKAYTSRVRLTRAASALLTTRRPVSMIAQEHGYTSTEVFIRAFTRLFGLSPGRYRARGLPMDDDRRVDVHAATMASVAPCVGLYHMSTVERSAVVPVDVVVKDLPAVHAIVMRRRIAREDVAKALGECLPKLFAYATREGLAMSGPPFARYPHIGLGSLVIEGGVQLAEPAPVALEDGIEALTIPAGPAAVAIHYGPYERLAETYLGIETWIQEAGRTVGGPPWEVYLTDPGERPDPATWETQLVVPLA